MTAEELDYRFVVHYKTYARFPRIIRDDAEEETYLERLIASRRTRREPSPKKIDGEGLHNIIARAMGKTGVSEEDEDFRAYPSAGARYPLEAYLIVVDVDGLESGLYHFCPMDSSLEILWIGQTRKLFMELPLTKEQPFLEHIKALVVFSSIDDRTVYKYNEEGRMFPLIEAGYAGANICLLCEEAGINTVILGTQWSREELAKVFDLNTRTEQVVSSIVIL